MVLSINTKNNYNERVERLNIVSTKRVYSTVIIKNYLLFRVLDHYPYDN